MTMKRRPTYSITKELYLTNFMTEMGINYFMQMMQKSPSTVASKLGELLKVTGSGVHCKFVSGNMLEIGQNRDLLLQSSDGKCPIISCIESHHFRGP